VQQCSSRVPRPGIITRGPLSIDSKRRMRRLKKTQCRSAQARGMFPLPRLRRQAVTSEE
jgi:hypothetical protein